LRNTLNRLSVPEPVRAFGLWALLTLGAVFVGFGLALAALAIVNAILPPFQYPADDDTWRDYGPAALAYGVWALTSVGGAMLAWRIVRRRGSQT
jgi:hypothetical protein